MYARELIRKEAICGMFVLMLLASSCNPASRLELELDMYREIAWDHLSPQERETVIHDVGDAVVDLDAEFQPWGNGEDTKQTIPAVSVRFNTEDDPIVGPIYVYIDPETRVVLGRAPRF